MKKTVSVLEKSKRKLNEDMNRKKRRNEYVEKV